MIQYKNKMNTFNSFYFLHIQKTAGRLYVYNFLLPLKKILKDSNIEYLDNRINSSDHSQWRDDLDNLTYITTLFRDPCKQVISLYVHGLTVDSNGQKINSSISRITKKDFFLWFKNNKEALKNYQSKNIISTTIKKEESFYLTFSKMNSFTKEDVFNRINKISLILKPEDLSENNIDKIQKKILFDLNINHDNIKQNLYNREHYRSLGSEFIYNELTDKEKKYIYSISSIDSEIYETKDIFYNLET